VRVLFSSALLGLVWFAAVNAFATLTACLIAGLAIRRVESIGTRGLLMLRLLPAATSILFTVFIFLPAHVRFEPAESDESFGIVLSSIALLGVYLVIRSGHRAFLAVTAGRRFDALVRRAGNGSVGGALEVGGLSGVSLSGIWRPRILIGSEARAALTPAELDVAISHEVAHRRALDNLKRFLMHSAPDFFGWTTTARQLEERWQAEAECEADAHAVMGDGQRAVLLASALVKVARLAGVGSLRSGSPAWSAFHVPSLLELRVRRLVAGVARPPVSKRAFAWSSAAAALVVPAGLWLLDFSYTLHAVTEAMVARLP
jgi:hypothetical protein